MDPAYARNLLYRTALNGALSTRRSELRRSVREQGFPQSASDDPAELVERRESRALVMRVLKRLSSSHASVLALRYSGYSYREVGEILGINANHVGVLLHRAEIAFEKEYRRVSSTRWIQVVGAVIAVCIAAISYAPLRSLGASVVAAIRWQAVQLVPISREDVRAMRPAIGTPSDAVEYSPEHAHFVGYLHRGDAERAAQQQILTPRYIPDSLVHGYVIFHVRGAQRYRLTIKSLHATLTRALPSIVEQTYGERQAYESHRGLSAAGIGVLPIPQGYIDIVQQPIAPVAITGATEDEARSYFRQRASVIPSVAAAIREGVDPLDHMILLRSDIQRIRPIAIQGVRGYAIENTDGYGSALVWQKNRVMHVVEGSFSTETLLRVARSLR
jgi:hypothetical protein